jgi:DNA-binding ferritin-like protein (Dps family)
LEAIDDMLQRKTGFRSSAVTLNYIENEILSCREKGRKMKFFLKFCEKDNNIKRLFRERKEVMIEIMNIMLNHCPIEIRLTNDVMHSSEGKIFDSFGHFPSEGKLLCLGDDLNEILDELISDMEEQLEEKGKMYTHARIRYLAMEIKEIYPREVDLI